MYVHKLVYAMAIPKVSNGDRQASKNKSAITIVFPCKCKGHFGASLKVDPSL